MPLTGIVNFGATIGSPMPGENFSLIATDGSHHALARKFSSTVEIAHAEAQTYTEITQAQWVSDLSSQGITGSFALTKRIGCPGTSKFWALGQDGFTKVVAGIRYIINAASSIAIDGYCNYTSSTNINYI